MKNLKQFIKKTPIISSLVVPLYKKFWHQQKFSAAYWIDKITENKNLKVVQIGSNDGKTTDPLFILINKNSKWDVIFVEPVPYLFEKLKANYSEEARFKFENALINDGSEQTFYWIKEEAIQTFPNLPFWYNQLGSFDKQHIVKHLKNFVDSEKLSPFIVQDKIKGITMSQLFKKYEIQQLDILHIDTEGADWQILSQLDLIHYTPLIILFEHTHLENTEKQAAIQFLESKYYIFQLAGDFLCINKNNSHLSIKDVIGLRISEH